MSKILEDLTKLLVVEGDVKIPLSDFGDKLNTKTTQEIKRLRHEAKEKLGQLMSQRDMPSGPHVEAGLLEDASRVVQIAKFQSFKWGMARFVKHPEVQVQSPTGKKLRENLNEMFQLNSTDKGFLEYLGGRRKNCAQYFGVGRQECSCPRQGQRQRRQKQGKGQMP